MLTTMTAREKQAHLESRIKEIDYMLQNAEVISEEQMDLKVVKPGTTVTILDLSEKMLNLKVTKSLDILKQTL